MFSILFPHTGRHNQVTEIVYRNICGACVLEVPNSQWETMKVIAYNRAKVLWDFKVQTEKQLLASEPDIEVVDNEKKTAVVRDAIVVDSNMRKKEHEKIEKYQELKEQLD